jgi:hypothetical protein
MARGFECSQIRAGQPNTVRAVPRSGVDIAVVPLPEHAEGSPVGNKQIPRDHIRRHVSAGAVDAHR